MLLGIAMLALGAALLLRWLLALRREDEAERRIVMMPRRYYDRLGE